MRQYRAKAEERRLMDLTACFEKIFQCKKQTDMSRFLNALRNEKGTSYIPPVKRKSE